MQIFDRGTCGNLNSPTLSLVVIVALSIFRLDAQTPLEYWFSYGGSVSLMSGSTLNIGYQDGYRPDYQKSYHQYRMAFSRSLGSQIRGQFYLVKTYSGKKNDLKLVTRYGLSFTTQLPDLANLRSAWDVDIEYFSKDEDRYRQRIVNSFTIRTQKYKVIDNIKVGLFLRPSFFLNFGGRSISQYAPDGEYLGEFKPTGFHRFRLGFGPHFSIGSFLVIPSLMMQREFNLPWDIRNKINTVDFMTGRIRNKFKNINVISIRVRYLIRSSKLGIDHIDSFETIEN